MGMQTWPVSMANSAAGRCQQASRWWSPGVAIVEACPSQLTLSLPPQDEAMSREILIDATPSHDTAATGPLLAQHHYLFAEPDCQHVAALASDFPRGAGTGGRIRSSWKD